MKDVVLLTVVDQFQFIERVDVLPEIAQRKRIELRYSRRVDLVTLGVFSLSEVVQSNIDEFQLHDGQELDFELVAAHLPPLLLDQTSQAFNLVTFLMDYLVVFPQLLAVRLRKHDPDVTAMLNDPTRPVIRTSLAHHLDSSLWPVPFVLSPAHRGRSPATAQGTARCAPSPSPRKSSSSDCRAIDRWPVYRVLEPGTFTVVVSEPAVTAESNILNCCKFLKTLIRTPFFAHRFQRIYGVPTTVARRHTAPVATLRQDVEVRVEHRQCVDLTVTEGRGEGGGKLFDTFELLLRECQGDFLSLD